MEFEEIAVPAGFVAGALGTAKKKNSHKHPNMLRARMMRRCFVLEPIGLRQLSKLLKISVDALNQWI